MRIAVQCHAVPDLVLDHEHSELFELFAEIFDIEADDAVVELDVGAVVEDLQRAVYVDLQCRCDALCLCFGLCAESRVQIAQDRHVFRYGVFKIFLIDNRKAAVNDGFFLGFDPVAAAHDQFAKGQDEIGFKAQGVVIIRVVEVDVHGIDVIMAGRGDVDDLPAQGVDQGIVFSFGITDDHVVFGDKEDIADLAFCGEGFTGAGRAEDQAVGVFEFLAVHHDHVVGEGIEPVIERLTFHEQFLCRKGNKDGRGGRCQRPRDRHHVQA